MLGFGVRTGYSSVASSGMRSVATPAIHLFQNHLVSFLVQQKMFASTKHVQRKLQKKIEKPDVQLSRRIPQWIDTPDKEVLAELKRRGSPVSGKVKQLLSVATSNHICSGMS